MADLLRHFLSDETGAGADSVVLIIGLSLLIVPTVQEIGGRFAVTLDRLVKVLR